MQIIEIKENQKEIWNEFIAKNNSEGFLQSWEWGEFQKSLGRKVWRIGIIEDKKNLESGIWNIENLVAVALIVKHDLPFGKSYLYCPRGPVFIESRIKNQESRILSFLFNKVRKISKGEKSLFLRIDLTTPLTPTLSRGERERWIKKSPNEIQPRNTLMLNLKKSEEELLKEMKQKTRYNIRLAEKKELRITNYELRIDNKKIFEEKFEEFWKLVEETSERDKFSSHSKNYYWQMLKSLTTTPLTPTRGFHSPNGAERSEAVEPKMQDLQMRFHSSAETMEPSNDSCSCSQKLQARLYLAEYENKTIAANIVLFFGDIAVYLHGASSNKDRNLMAPYLLQWQQILDAKKAGCKKYDFWGIAPMVRQAHHDNNWGGITKFKKGFGGEEKNYIGAYDLVFDSIGYTIYKIIRKVKSL